VLKDTSKGRQLFIRFGSLHWTDGGAEESKHKVDMDQGDGADLAIGTSSRGERAGVGPVNFQTVVSCEISNEQGAMMLMLIGEP